MKKIFIILTLVLLSSLFGCNSMANYDLTNLEACINDIKDNDDTTICDFDESKEVMIEYQKNYAKFFSDDIEYHSAFSYYEEHNFWDITVWFAGENREEITNRMADNFIRIYENIVEDFKSLVGEDNIRLNLNFTSSNNNFIVTFFHQDTEEGLYQVYIYEQNDILQLDDVKNVFNKWEDLFDMDKIDIVFINLGENEYKNLRIQLFFSLNGFYFGGELYGIDQSDVEEIILDNTEGLSNLNKD